MARSGLGGGDSGALFCEVKSERLEDACNEELEGRGEGFVIGEAQIEGELARFIR